MGFPVSTDARGTYFLKTNPNSDTKVNYGLLFQPKDGSRWDLIGIGNVFNVTNAEKYFIQDNMLR